jgi:hypothetical protein
MLKLNDKNEGKKEKPALEKKFGMNSKKMFPEDLIDKI